MIYWIITLGVLILVLSTWFVTLTFYPPKQKRISRSSLSTYCQWRLISDPDRNRGEIEDGGGKTYAYVPKEVCFLRGVAVLLLLWECAAVLITYQPFKHIGNWGILVWWILFISLVTVIPIASVWTTYRKPDDGLVSIFEAIRVYPVFWMWIVLGCSIAAASSLMPNGALLREWFYDRIASRSTLINALAAILLATIGGAFLPEPFSPPPPEGFTNIPLQWRLWLGATCVVGFSGSAILIGFAQ